MIVIDDILESHYDAMPVDAAVKPSARKTSPKQTISRAASKIFKADPWQDWKPDWADRKSPHRQQESHSPTENISVRLTAEKTQQQSQRRIVDARLWDAMSPIQQQAAIEITTAYETMGKGLGYVSSNWARIPGARGQSNVAEAHARLINNYIHWTKACHSAKISHAMAIDVLVFGFPCRLIDRDRRVRTGTTRHNLMEGLSLYCRLKGWSQ